MKKLLCFCVAMAVMFAARAQKAVKDENYLNWRMALNNFMAKPAK